MTNDNRAMTAHDAHAHGGDMQLPTDGGPLAVDHMGGASRGKNLLHLMHLSLRGRYWLVIPLSLLLCAAGVYAGWKYFDPKYRSIGRIQIQYEIATVNANEQPKVFGQMNQYEQVMNTQIGVIMSQDTITNAMHDPDWVKCGRGTDNEAMKKFIENLTVEHPHDTQLLDITLQDSDPFVAATGVRSLVRIYKEWYEARESRTVQALLYSLLAKVSDKKKEIESTNRDIDNLVKNGGSEDFTAFIRAQTVRVLNGQEQLDRLNTWLAQLESNGNPAQAIDRLTLQQIGILYAPMQAKLQAVSQAQGKLSNLKARYGDNHESVKQARAELDAASDDASQFAQDWRTVQLRFGNTSGADAPADQNVASGKKDDTLGVHLAQTPEAVRKQIDACTERNQKNSDQLHVFESKQREVTKYKDKVVALQKELAEAEKDLANYRNESNRGINRLIVLTPGEIPIQPYKDPRKPAVAGLGLAGLALPFALFLLIGFADRRFRFSDQADSSGVGLPPLLGILPTLPDRLEDPEPAAMAAHCVHQLRIMLQVNTANTAQADGGSVPDRRAYVITSASPGDGKTSLTMALGLSYAASGSRTLVIDCDMVGQGLTNRLKANSTEGLLEALQAGTLAGRVKKTTTANLYILPIGGAESAHAGALSPQTIRKLLVEARRIFDVTIIDTGPILGSLEAQVVCAAADSVILTVARGQQQPLVQRALRMLRQIGASVGGMVFNRAQQRDFEKSVTSSSIRSMGPIQPARRALLGETAEESRFGPLARSVASFMPSSPTTVKPIASKVKADVAPADGIRVEVVSRMVEAPASEDTVYGEDSPADDEGHGTPQ